MVMDANTEGTPQANAVAGEDPIVVTGGSVILEYPDQPGNNHFADDGMGTGKKGRMKRLKNKSQGTDKAELTSVRILVGQTLSQQIDLTKLGKNSDLRIEIHYAIP